MTSHSHYYHNASLTVHVDFLNDFREIFSVWGLPQHFHNPPQLVGANVATTVLVENVESLLEFWNKYLIFIFIFSLM